MGHAWNLNSQEVRERAEKAREGFQLLPVGTHRMKCTAVEYKETAAGNDAWELMLEVVKGEEHAGTTCKGSLFFTDKAIHLVFICLSAFGCKGHELDTITPLDPEHRDLLVGRVAMVEVEHSEPNAKGQVWANPTFAGYHRLDGETDGNDDVPANDDPAKKFQDIPF